MRSPRRRLAILALACALASAVWAGGGPENLLLVVNGDSPDSVAVAAEYARLRQVPPGNVLTLTGLPATPVISVADFRNLILEPIRQALRARGLAGQVDYIAYSAGFPYGVDVSADMAGQQFPRVITQPASLTGLTYFRDLMAAGDMSCLALDANWYARTVARPGASRAALTEAERAQQARLRAILAEHEKARETGTSTPEMARALEEAVAILRTLLGSHRASPELLYDLACVLALQGKPEEAMAALQEAFAAGWWAAMMTEADADLASLRGREDFRALVAKMREVVVEVPGPRPFRATTRWGEGGDIAGPGEGRRYVLAAMLAYTGGPANTLEEALACLRRSAVADGTCPKGTIYYMTSTDWARTGPREWAFRSAVAALEKLGVHAEVLQGVLPPDKADVAGAMVGIAGFSWPESHSAILPGAFCDHLTSFGGLMTGAGQTLLSEFLRHGAAGACGTVTEPYAIAAKFPSPFLHVYYAGGCSLAEAFYQSLRGPYQQLLVGDPLCRPWARPPRVRVSGLAAGDVVTRSRWLVPEAEGAEPVTRFELYVDGVLQRACPPGGRLRLDTRSLAPGAHEARILAVAGPMETRGRLLAPFRCAGEATAVPGTPNLTAP